MLIAMGSWRGSPGVTTAALALAEAWPNGPGVFVMECDPRGGTLVPRFLMPGQRRLAELAGDARHGGDLSLLGKHAVVAPGGAKVLTGPEDGRQLCAALAVLLAPGGVLERAAADTGTVVLADCGRLDPDVPEIVALLKLADTLVLTLRPAAEQVLALSGSRPQISELHEKLSLLLVGSGYASDQVSELLQLPVLGRLPLVATGRAGVWERLSRRSALADAASEACAALTTRLRAPIQMPTPRSAESVQPVQEGRAA
jgi:hypothetical protein